MRIKGMVLAICLAVMPQAFAGGVVRITEGAQVRLRLLETLSSSTATEGQRFNLELEDDIQVDGKVVVPRGAKGVGTVMSARKKGFMGKGGELNVMLDYVQFNDQRIRVRATGSREGNDKLDTAVALTVLFGPLGLLKRGHDVEMIAGTVITGVVDESIEVNLP